MTKQHFIALADAIREHNRVSDNRDRITGDRGGYTKFTPDQLDGLAIFCKQQNSNFKRERWLDYINGQCGPNGGKVN